MEYDEYGNEIKRWFIDQNENITHIYNGIFGVVSKYDDKDRLINQYFINEQDIRIYDRYNYHGVQYKYNTINESLISEIWYIDTNDNPCNNPCGFGIETRTIGEDNLVKRQSYFDSNGNNAMRHDGAFSYSSLLIEYDAQDRPIKLLLVNDTGLVTKQIKYEYDNRGCITKSTFYGGHVNEEYISISNENGVYETRYEHDNHGALCSQSYWGKNNEMTIDSNGYSRIELSYDKIGKLIKREFYGANQKFSILDTVFNYQSNGICEIIQTEYQIKTIEYYENISKRIGIFKKKFQKEVREVISEERTKGILNGKGELTTVYLDSDNDYISGEPLVIHRKYNDNSDIIEERMFNENNIPICDKDSNYGWQIKNDPQNGVFIKLILGKDGLIANNKHGYAIIREIKESIDNLTSTITTYYDKDYNPVECELGFHKMISSLSNNDDSFQNVNYFDRNDNPCDCSNGYHAQIYECISSNDEIKRIVRFISADGTPKINTLLGYHKQEEIFSISKDMLISKSFYDENSSLINVSEGFARITFKRYDSFKTLFYFPFNDHDIVRFYDSVDNKTNVDYLGFHGYKYIVSTSYDSVCKHSVTPVF